MVGLIGYLLLKLSHFEDIPLLFTILEMCRYNLTSLKYTTTYPFDVFITISGPIALEFFLHDATTTDGDTSSATAAINVGDG